MAKRLYTGRVVGTMWLGLGGLWPLQWWELRLKGSWMYFAQAQIISCCFQLVIYCQTQCVPLWWICPLAALRCKERSAATQLAQIIQISGLPPDCDSRLWWLCKPYKRYVGTNPEAVLHRTHPKDMPLKQLRLRKSECLPVPLRKSGPERKTCHYPMLETISAFGPDCIGKLSITSFSLQKCLFLGTAEMGRIF